MCQALVDDTQTTLTGAFDPVFEALEGGIGQVANVLDALVGAIDPKAGQCSNYANNPYVMVSRDFTDSLQIGSCESIGLNR